MSADALFDSSNQYVYSIDCNSIRIEPPARQMRFMAELCEARSLRNCSLFFFASFPFCLRCSNLSESRKLYSTREDVEKTPSRHLSIANFASLSFNFFTSQQSIDLSMSVQEQEELVQALADRLITAVDEQDVLFTLFWLNESRERNLIKQVVQAKRT